MSSIVADQEDITRIEALIDALLEYLELEVHYDQYDYDKRFPVIKKKEDK